MKALIVGATGATGSLLVKQLLERGVDVKAIVRSAEKLPITHENLSIVEATLLDLTDDALKQYVEGCDVVASCLGHNMNLKGIYGQPRRLVTDATARLCRAIKAHQPEKPIKFVLMNTAGNSNRDLSEPLSFAEKTITSLIRVLLPPHADNENAADYLRGEHDKSIEWVVVRPDSLIDANAVTDYEAFPSPIRSAIFNAGTTSRINVGHFMADLITDDDLWHKWKGQMPVIYNKA